MTETPRIIIPPVTQRRLLHHLHAVLNQRHAHHSKHTVDHRRRQRDDDRHELRAETQAYEDCAPAITTLRDATLVMAIRTAFEE